MDDHFKRLDTYLSREPRLGQGVYIAQGAVVMGDVTVGDHGSVWFNAVVRGDINRIEIGHHSNIQDNAVVHLADDYPCLIGDWVTIGHGAIVHACQIGHESLIGMGAVILDGARVGNQCLIAAQSVVTPGMEIPDGSMVVGAPARILRALSEEERRSLKVWAEKYVANTDYYLRHKIRLSPMLPPP